MCKDNYMSKYRVHYIGGLDNVYIAKVTFVHIEKDGLALLNQRVKWDDITSVEVKHDMSAGGFNAGGAIAGKLLFGNIGMLAGGMGGAKVDNFAVIEYGEPTKQLILKLLGAPLQQQKFAKRLMDRETTNQPKLSFAERTALNRQQSKDKLEAKRAQHKERLTDLKAQATDRHERALERNQRQRDQLSDLGGKFKGIFRKAK
jgi:hypothetical protein